MDKNYPEKTQALHVTYWKNQVELLPQNLSKDSNLMNPNMRFNHKDISFSIDSGCNVVKTNKILEALLTISNLTKILNFYPTNQENSDIDISCSKKREEISENEIIAGEGGPVVINSTIYPLIIGGNIYLYNTLNCEKPITELHELLHVFGFLHVSEPSKIMYPYLDCNQIIDERVITTLKEIYSQEPKSDLAFIKVGAAKTGRYLDVSVEISNAGIVDAKNVTFDLYISNEKIESYALNKIGYGAGKTVYLSNIPLPIANKGKVILNLSTSTSEYNYQNNYVELTPSE